MSYYLKRLINLHTGAEESTKTLENVKNNISFKGDNLWSLACAIIIASIGLNTNSATVIIGAMLISPLMGPVLASGFALGIYDFALLKRALRNLLIATLTSLLASTTYFVLSPFKTAQSELLAYTSPTIFDILIAFIGGLIGVIAVTRIEKNNRIAGVAIATALMPPLCTAGYGLATGNINFFLGAFFLFIINGVFICIATFLIIKYLKYPPVQQVDEKHQKQVKYSIWVIILLMVLPSGYFAYRLYEKQKFEQSVNSFIEKEFAENGFTLIYKKTNYNSSPKRIEIAFLSNNMSLTEEDEKQKKLPAYGINNTRLLIRHNDDVEALKNDLLNEVGKSENILNEKDKIIRDLQEKIAAIRYDNPQIKREVQSLFPEVEDLALAKHHFGTNTDSSEQKDSSNTVLVMLYRSKSELENDKTITLKKWLRERLSAKELILVHQTSSNEKTEKTKK